MRKTTFKANDTHSQARTHISAAVVANEKKPYSFGKKDRIFEFNFYIKEENERHIDNVKKFVFARDTGSIKISLHRFILFSFFFIFSPFFIFHVAYYVNLTIYFSLIRCRGSFFLFYGCYSCC